MTDVEWKRPLWYNEDHQHKWEGGERILFRLEDPGAWTWGTVLSNVRPHGYRVYVMPDEEHLATTHRVYPADERAVSTNRTCLMVHLYAESNGTPMAYHVQLDLRPADAQTERRAMRCAFCNDVTGELVDIFTEKQKFLFCEGCRNLPLADGRRTNVERTVISPAIVGREDDIYDEDPPYIYDDPDIYNEDER